jgi:GT2 family glycosyltransferase
MNASSEKLGVVVIGRNEGARLARCLASLQSGSANHPIVYVDSASTDGSPALARARGADVVELDTSQGFTMARGRNAGMRRLLERIPDLELIQFLDGDCELQPTWLEIGERTMAARPDAAVVSGRRRERRRDANVYHRLMDMEWDTPIGEVVACHGDALMRVAFLRAAGPFDESLIAGEEPELCARLRAAGGRIVRVDAEMSVHDVAIDRFGQWWRRCLRSGHAEAQAAARHGWLHDKAATRVLLSAWLWVCVVPLALALASWQFGPWALLGFLVYPLHAAKIAWGRWRRGAVLADAALYALFIQIGRGATLLGHWSLLRTRLQRRPSTLIEYKSDARKAT